MIGGAFNAECDRFEPGRLHFFKHFAVKMIGADAFGAEFGRSP